MTGQRQTDTQRWWVAYVDGTFYLRWQNHEPLGWFDGGHRPLTFTERIVWRIAARPPRPPAPPH